MAFPKSFEGGGPKKNVSVKVNDCRVRSSSNAGMDAADRFHICIEYTAIRSTSGDRPERKLSFTCRIGDPSPCLGAKFRWWRALLTKRTRDVDFLYFGCRSGLRCL